MTAFIPRKVLPADMGSPAHASGMMRLKADFTGPAITLLRRSNNSTATFSYESNGKLPLAAIDAFRAPEPSEVVSPGPSHGTTGLVRVIQRADQISALPGFNTDYASSFTFGPKFGSLTIGGHRCMWMEGDAEIENSTRPQEMQMLKAQNVAALGIKQNAMTVMQVLQLHNSSFQGMSLRGAVFSTDTLSVGIQPGTRIFAEWNQPANTVQTTGNGFVVECPIGMRLAGVGGWRETSPIVMTYITGPSGSFIGQNEDFRSFPPTGTPTAADSVELFIGCHEQSFPPAPVNEAAGMAELLTIVWPRTMGLQEAAAIRASIYDVAEIDPRHSHSNAPLIVLCTDSVWAGYKGDDLRVWDKVAMNMLPSYVRWANFAVGGSGIIIPPGATGFGCCALRWFPGWMAQAVRQHRGRVHFVWGAPINDYYDGTVTPSFVYNEGILKLIELIRGVDPSAAVTICTGTRSVIQKHDDDMRDGSVLIRNGAAANNYNVVEVRNDPVMGIQPTAGDMREDYYKDGLHLGNAGCRRMAELIVPTLSSWLQTHSPF